MMKQSFKSMMLMGAFLFSLLLCFTSCDPYLDDILGHWERPTYNTGDGGEGGGDEGGGEGGGSTTVKVTSITLDKTLLPIHVGDADVTLTATVKPDDATNKAVTWNSDKTAVATVDEAGKVHAVAIGTAIITATAKDGSGIKATCNVSVLPAGALAGVFSVSATKKVWFSQGNLQAVFASAGSSCTWQFATNQWDFIGDNMTTSTGNGNTSIDGNGTVSAAGTVDLFGWVGESNNTWTGAAQYGISNKIQYYTTTTSDYGNVSSENLKSDWGNTIATDWYTLTKDEWEYLFNTRTVNGGTGAGHSYTLGKNIYGPGGSATGIVLYPDNYEGAEFTDGPSSVWATFEEAGCVFLPAAGHRNGTAVANPGFDCHYWSSSPKSATNAYQVSYTTSTLKTDGDGYRCTGHSVRLVYNAQ